MVLHYLILVPLLANAGPPVRPTSADEKALAELLARVRREGDRVDTGIFPRIAAFQTRASLEALESAVDHLHADAVIFRAYLAFSNYRRVPELEAEAIEFLYSEACNHEDEGNQRLAAQGLTYFHAPAHPALERLVREHPSDIVRAVALQPVIPLLGKSGTPDDARLILDHAEIRGGRTAQFVAEALAGCKGEEVDRMVAERLGEEDLSLAWTEILLSALGTRSGPEVDAALTGALQHESSLVRTRALELLGQREDPELYAMLRPHLRATDGLERCQAILSVTAVARRERSWPRKLLRYARSRNVAERVGAAGGLAMIATDEAREALEELLADEDWRVRLEAVERLAGLRRKDSIPLLIERMGGESNRLRRSIARALRRLSAQDHGQSPARWAEWWAAECATFVVPSAEVADEADARRREHHESSATTASFYGLPLVSQQVAFVLDVSGSMLSPAGTRGRTRSEPAGAPEETRLDVAKVELAGALERMSRDVHFNVIFFNTAVLPWRAGLVRRSDREAEDAVRFAMGQVASGDTNVHGALMKAFEDPTIDTIYLLSDGNPSAGELVNPDQLREHVSRVNRLRKVQIHCISIGQPSPFLRQLAQENDGDYAEAL